jgi:hypothetical protein
MTTPHDLISSLADALNARDERNLIAIFAEHAVICDGGLRFRGPAGIRDWIQSTLVRHGLSLKVLSVSGQGREWLFDAIVSGAFEGSPVRVEHCVTIEDGKIAQLDI